jgi:hypothetical protein
MQASYARRFSALGADPDGDDIFMNEMRNRNYRPNRPRPAGDRGGGGAKYRHRQLSVQGRPHPNGTANAQRNYERYMALAREAALSGDKVEMENCYQHAEHYFRVMRERTT